MQKRAHLGLLSLAVAISPAFLACSSSTEPAPGEDGLLAPPPAGQGVQYEMKTKLEPGTEAEHCKFVQAPAEGMFVNRDEVRFTKGSHHFLLYETTYTSIPTKGEDGTIVDTSGVFDCTEGATSKWNVTKLIAGSQNADGDAFLNFPSDVAMRVEPGRVLLMNAHYINATPEVLEPEVRVNLYTIPEAQVKQQGDILFWYNAFIKVGAKSTGRARMKCQIHDDITLTNIQSHMHARGVGYEAFVVGGAGGEAFYTSESWEDVPVKRFDGGMKIGAGTWLDYYCDYNNAGATDVFQGPKSTDEMCMLVGSYYPASAGTAACSAVPSLAEQTRSLGAEWVGNGTATCAKTFQCVQLSIGGGGDVMKSLTSCMMQSDPGVSKEMSNAVRCLLLNYSDAQTVCESEFNACLAK